MSTWKKLVYSGGSLGSTLSDQALGLYLFFFYVDVLKLSPALVGTGMIIYSIWNAINDPLLGYVSDRTRTRWGRRIPYVVGGALPLALSFFLVWSPQLFFGPAQPPFWYFLMAVLFFDFFYTMVVLNWTALFPEMFDSLEQRSQVSSQRQMFTLLGLVLASGGAFLYEWAGWPALGVLFGGVSALALGLSVAGAREDPSRRGEDLPLGAAIRYTFVNRSFLSFAFTSFFIQMVFRLLLAALPFYVKYVLQLPQSSVTLIQVALIVITAVSLLVWRRLSVRWGAKRAMQTAILLFAAMLPLFGLPKGLSGAMGAAAAVGIGLGGILLLLDVLLSDVIDEDAVVSGARREGMYFGVHALILRLNISVQGLIQAAVLTATGYDANLAVQPDSAVLGIRLLMTAVPVAVALAALGALSFYPLAGERLREVKERLRVREPARG